MDLRKHWNTRRNNNVKNHDVVTPRKLGVSCQLRSWDFPLNPFKHAPLLRSPFQDLLCGCSGRFYPISSQRYFQVETQIKHNPFHRGLKMSQKTIWKITRYHLLVIYCVSLWCYVGTCWDVVQIEAIRPSWRPIGTTATTSAKQRFSLVGQMTDTRVPRIPPKTMDRCSTSDLWKVPWTLKKQDWNVAIRNIHLLQTETQ